MKKIYSLAILLVCLFLTAVCNAQIGFINTVAGNGSYGTSGDGGLAINASIGIPYGIAMDSKNNLYIADVSRGKIRKVTPSGIITTFAGNATGTYSGDGGPATAAGITSNVTAAVSTDNIGNVYLIDNNRIRKVNSSGIITTIAGNGTYGTSGDGGPATGATVVPESIVCDNANNIYYGSTYSQRIRMINSSGIISTFAGTGIAGFSGDGGPATAAQLNTKGGIATDFAGNFYIADSGNNRVRMINPSGIITTIAGNGIAGFSGDGGLAISAELNCPQAVTVDSLGNVYVACNDNRIRRINRLGIITTIAGTGTYGDSGDGWISIDAKIQAAKLNCIIAIKNSLYIAETDYSKVRMVSLLPEVPADSFSVNVGSICEGIYLGFQSFSYAPAYNIKTYYGDGTFDSISLVNSGSLGYASLIHSYHASGTYSIKHYLRNGSTIIDSVSYSHVYSLCNVIPVTFYSDISSNCSYNSSTDPLNIKPTLTEVDSNGVFKDTISATSGFYYTAYGNPGDIYTFKTVSPSVLLSNICPTSGILSDTLQVGTDTTNTNYFGFGCTATTGFDLSVNAVVPVTGIRDQWGHIYVENTSCNLENAAVTLNISPKYIPYIGTNPTPTSFTGNSMTWNLNNLSVTSPFGSPIDLYYVLIYNPAIGFLTPRDTVQEHISVTPTVGDINTRNNFDVIIDTVKAGVDPNEMWVSPQGYISSGTQLLYTVNFENTGNDTAFNIYVMDTLSDFVDPKSLRIVFASKVMNVTKIYDNIEHNIIRFDFPNINLLDSSHHNQCNSMFSFTLNTLNGLPDGSVILNEAGIYFDINPVVMTNVVEDIIGSPESVPAIDGGNNNSKDKVIIFPNPASNELTLKTTPNAYTSFTIINTLGQLVMEQEIAGTQTVINIKSLPSGVYYISLRGDNVNSVEKFVKL